MNPYQTLGLAPGCTDADVEAAYRRVASSGQPDSGGSNGPLLTVAAAYERLKTEKARRAYDQQSGMTSQIVAEFFDNCIPRMEATR